MTLEGLRDLLRSPRIERVGRLVAIDSRLHFDGSPRVGTPPMTPAGVSITHDLVTTRGSLLDHPALPVLIRVPALRTISRSRAKRRRRLRREVRLGGLALLLGTPLLAIGAWLPQKQDILIGSGGRATLSDNAPPPPMVSLLPTLEPVPAALGTDRPGTMSEPPDAEENWVDAWEAARAVTAPEARPTGYLLPELPVMEVSDGGEESPHAGS